MANDTSIALHAGDVIVVEYGEGYTFAESTTDYFHFVLHCLSIQVDKVLGE